MAVGSSVLTVRLTNFLNSFSQPLHGVGHEPLLPMLQSNEIELVHLHIAQCTRFMPAALRVEFAECFIIALACGSFKTKGTQITILRDCIESLKHPRNMEATPGQQGSKGRRKSDWMLAPPAWTWGWLLASQAARIGMSSTSLQSRRKRAALEPALAPSKVAMSMGTLASVSCMAFKALLLKVGVRKADIACLQSRIIAICNAFAAIPAPSKPNPDSRGAFGCPRPFRSAIRTTLAPRFPDFASFVSTEGRAAVQAEVDGFLDHRLRQA